MRRPLPKNFDPNIMTPMPPPIAPPVLAPSPEMITPPPMQPEMFGTAPPPMQPPIQPPVMQPPPPPPMQPEIPMPDMPMPPLGPSDKPMSIAEYLVSAENPEYRKDYDINKDGKLSIQDQLYAEQIDAGMRDPETLEAIKEQISIEPEPEPKKKPTRNKRGGRGGRAVGGSTDSESMLIEIVQKDPLASEVVQFVLGNSDNQEVIPAFVEKYGNELFLQLREAVLQELAPDAQTEGLIQGVGNGGMDDDINGTIGDKEKIAVSQDEFIIPADVVSMLGDGSSQAGSEELYNMMDRVRQAKTGTAEQAPRLANKGGFLPA